MTFRVGMKVACIARKQWVGDKGNNRGPKYKEVCTVAYITNDDEGAWLGLEGYSPTRWVFEADRFRPLTKPSTKTGMAILRKILDTAENEIVPAE